MKVMQNFSQKASSRFFVHLVSSLCHRSSSCDFNIRSRISLHVRFANCTKSIGEYLLVAVFKLPSFIA